MLLRTVLLATLSLAAPALAQNLDAPTIQALLTEVRQLRLALERSALVAPKIQLTMQRLQLQDQKVARISTQLDTLRRDISQQTLAAKRAVEDLTTVEQRLAAEPDLVLRKQLEEHRTMLKATAARVVDPQLLARESEMSSGLRNEQALLQELSDRLAGIERLLDAPVAPAPQQR